MKTFSFDQFRAGWFVGNFEPAAFRTNSAEVSFKRHNRGEPYQPHRHDIATEINLLISGSMKIQDQVIEAGTVFVLEPGEVADPVFLDNCELVVVKVPSVPGDWHPV